MPELPEVTTTVNGINTECKNWVIKNAWTNLATNKPSRIDFYQTIKYLPYFKNFVKNTKNQKIINTKRRGKNILIELENKKTILIHMKMTGHMMVGLYDYVKKDDKWIIHKDEKNQALYDPFNRFVNFVFVLQKDNKIKHLVLCDARKFAKVALLENEQDYKKHLGIHGPEPINPDISLNDFIKALDNAPANSRAIKTILMDIRTIAGIGNIYSDEMLFISNIDPKSIWSKIPKKEKSLLHKAMLKVLKTGIEFGGDSMSDYRNIYGKKGEFQNNHNAYKKTGQKCNKKSCKGAIKREMINSRSSHFCPVHQKLYK